MSTLLDFAVDENLNFIVEDGKLKTDDSGLLTIVSALFSNRRVNEKEGYFGDIADSRMWVLAQSALTEKDMGKIRNIISDCLSKLEEKYGFTFGDYVITMEGANVIITMNWELNGKHFNRILTIK